MTNPPTNTPAGSGHPAATAVMLALAGAAALVVSALLALWAVDQVATTRLWRVETVVAPLVVAVGALAGAWVGVSSLVAGTCAAVRVAGGAWRAGERAVQRWAPGLVRRALAVAVAAGVGVTGAAGAHAAVEAPPAASAVTVDLGWTPTSADPTVSPTLAAEMPGTGTTPTPTPTTLPSLPADGTDGTGGTGGTGGDGDLPAVLTSTPGDDAGAAQLPADAPSAPSDASPRAVVVPVVAHVPPAADAATETPDAPAAPAASAPPADGTVDVRPGDTLWGLAARSLGPDASDAAIAAEWPRWYAANASTIGPDPDVLTPGQVLVVPAPVDGGVR